MCTHPLTLFQPLAIAWATLADRGLIPGASSKGKRGGGGIPVTSAAVCRAGGLARMRGALRSLAANYDGSTSDRSLLAVLAVSGASDLAADLVDNADRVSSDISLACNAAAGNWTRAADMLIDDFQRSIYYPRCAGRGGQQLPPVSSCCHLLAPLPHLRSVSFSCLATSFYHLTHRLTCRTSRLHPRAVCRP